MFTVGKEVQPDRRVAHRRGSVRPWWSRGHTYFLVLLLLSNIFLDRFAFKPDGEATTILWAGILLAQTFLMGFWMALGGLHAILRSIAVAATTAGGAFAFLMSLDADQLGTEHLQIFLLAGTIVLATYVVLLPLRLLLSWRADFDRAYHANHSRGRMQLGLADCIHIVTACALLAGCARYLDHNLVTAAASGGGIAFLNSSPIALLVVARRPSVRAWLLGATVLGISLIVEYVVMVYGSAVTGLFFLFEFALVATLLLNLLPLRFIFGLHLFSVAAGAQQTAELVEQGLAEVEAAWPKLPETIRAQIVTLARSGSTSEG